jgi:hypothetical protein
VFASHESGSLFTPGTHNVNYVAYDKAGNNATCDMEIFVQSKVNGFAKFINICIFRG